MGGFYYQNQTNFNAAACTGSGAFISSSKCGGSQTGLSFLLDWKRVKRVDIYAGVLVSNVYGGLANGFFSRPPPSSSQERPATRKRQYGPDAELRPDGPASVFASTAPGNGARRAYVGCQSGAPPAWQPLLQLSVNHRSVRPFVALVIGGARRYAVAPAQTAAPPEALEAPPPQALGAMAGPCVT